MNEKWMKEAIQLAHQAQAQDEVPIGCVIVKDDTVIATGYNQREQTQQADAHAEMIAIRQACQVLNSWRLEGCDLYVTLEPCPMCAGAIIQSRIEHVYFGAKDPKGGCVGSCTNLFTIQPFNHHPQFTGGVCEEECAELLTNYFKEKRCQKKA